MYYLSQHQQLQQPPQPSLLSSPPPPLVSAPLLHASFNSLHLYSFKSWMCHMPDRAVYFCWSHILHPGHLNSPNLSHLGLHFMDSQLAQAIFSSQSHYGLGEWASANLHACFFIGKSSFCPYCVLWLFEMVVLIFNMIVTFHWNFTVVKYHRIPTDHMWEKFAC